MAHGSIPHPSAQSRTPVPGPDGTPARQPWAVLVLLCVAEFMVILDITVVNVALPSIGRALGLGAAGLPWVITAYVLMTGGLTLLGGRAADLLGRRRVFLAGLALFTAASLASGLAPAAGLLIGARAAQGVGAALLTPAALSVITATYAGAQRVTALSVWGALGAAGAAAGVLLGGVLTTWLGWRSVFLINVPVGAAAWILAGRLIPRPAAAARGLARLDLPGAVLGVTGLGTAIYAITGAPGHGWASAWTIGLLLVAALLLAAFALAERAGRDPLFPPRAWRNRRLASGALVMLGATGVLVAAFFLGSLYLQDVLGYSPIRAGLGFPAPGPGDRGGRAPGVPAAGPGRLPGAGRGWPGADGRGRAAAGPGQCRGGLPRPAARLPGPRLRHRAGLPGRLGDRPRRRRPRGRGVRLRLPGHRPRTRCGAGGGGLHRDRRGGHQHGAHSTGPSGQEAQAARVP